MASPAAYEEPTIETSWRAFLEHLPTLLLIWVVSTAITVFGVLTLLVVQAGGVGLDMLGGFADRVEGIGSIVAQLVQLPFTILANLVGVLFTAVPVLHYASGRVISVGEGFQELARRPGRYLLAGILFVVASTIGGLFCVLPGIAVLLVMPVYVNLIFTGDRPVLDAFQAAFQACYGTPQGRSFLLVEILVWLVVLSVSLCTCLLGWMVVGPMSCFYLQNLAYHRGVVH